MTMMHDHDDDVDGGHATLHNLVAQVEAQLQWLRFPTKTASDAAVGTNEATTRCGAAIQVRRRQR